MLRLYRFILMNNLHFKVVPVLFKRVSVLIKIRIIEYPQKATANKKY